MVNPFLVGVLSGFVPAMALLYVMLHRYEGFFDERRVFRALLFGMLAGFLVTLAEFLLAPAATLAPGAALVTIVVGYPALEAAVTTAAMNRQQYRGRKDTPYYASAFGLGLGALNALLLAARSAQVQGNVAFFDPDSLLFYAVLVQLTVAVVLVHGAAAVVIGQKTAEGMPFTGMLRGLLVLVPFGIIVGLSGVLVTIDTAGWGLLMPTGGLAYGAFAAWRVRDRILDNVVPDELAQQVRRELRKRMRGEDRPAEPPPADQPSKP